MTNLMQYQLEQAGETATLYLAGELGYENVSTLIDVCGSLPARIRTLRLDLHAIGGVSAEATDVVRQLLRHWRSSRRGEFRLSTSHLLATCSQIEPPYAPPNAGWTSALANDALTGTYL